MWASRSKNQVAWQIVNFRVYLTKHLLIYIGITAIALLYMRLLWIVCLTVSHTAVNYVRCTLTSSSQRGKEKIQFQGYGTLLVCLLSFSSLLINLQQHSTAITAINLCFNDAGLTSTSDFKHTAHINSAREQERARCLWCQRMAQRARMISSTGCLNGLT